MAKWIEFEFAPAPANQKTQRFNVVSIQGRDVLGQVKWFGRWRKYCFFPAPDMVFEEDCLRDIARFLEQVTTEYKGKTKAAGA